MPRCTLVDSTVPHRAAGPQALSSADGLGDLRAGLDRLADRLDALSAGFLELRALLREGAPAPAVNSSRRRRAPASRVFSARQPTLAPAGPSRG